MCSPCVLLKKGHWSKSIAVKLGIYKKGLFDSEEVDVSVTLPYKATKITQLHKHLSDVVGTGAGTNVFSDTKLHCG